MNDVIRINKIVPYAYSRGNKLEKGRVLLLDSGG